MSRANEFHPPRRVMPKLLQKLVDWEPITWVVSSAVTVLVFLVSAAFVMGTYHQLITQMSAKFEQQDAGLQAASDKAQVAASTAQAAAAQVTHLQAGVAKADDKLDTILEAQGKTTGQLELLIQLQRNQLQAGFKEWRPTLPRPVYVNNEPRVITK